MKDKNYKNIHETMNIVIVGHVDHGKSTIIGRLLSDTNSLPQGKLQQVKEKCRKNAKPFEYAFLLDALKDEQAQGITIDSARCFFKTEERKYIIVDAPGHIEFLKNMVTGASSAEAALLVIDANEGIKENSRRHGYMLSILGIKQVAILINKMDLVNYSEENYKEIVKEYTEFLSEINISPLGFIPVSGRNGDNIALKSSNMAWYKGYTVLQELDRFKNEKINTDKIFRMPVQDVYKFTENNDNRRIVVGTIECGKLSVGDEVSFYPSGKKSSVKSIEIFNEKNIRQTCAGKAIGFTLDEQIFVRRGEIAFITNQCRPKVSNKIRATIFWLGKEPMAIGKEYIFKLGTAKGKVKLEKIIKIVDSSNLTASIKNKIEKNDAAECILSFDKEMAFDTADKFEQTSRFVIVDDYEISGGGIIKEEVKDVPKGNKNLKWHNGKVSYEDRSRLLGQKGIVVWFTGLPSSGKSTIAVEVESRLFKKQKLTYRIDGDNLRHGINSDLGFSKSDRFENIRRSAEIASLLKDTGIIVLASFVSPYEESRELARKIIGKENFIEVYVKANKEKCIERDPKGLYKKALLGEIKNFTGISDGYEEPAHPNLVVDTAELNIEQAANKVIDIIKEHIKMGGY